VWTAPLIDFTLQAILVWSLVTFTGKTYGDGSSFPAFANILGWLMIAFAIIFIPLMAIVAIVQKKGNVFEVL